MKERNIRAKETINKRITDLLFDEEQVTIETLMLEAGRKILQEALEEEVSDYLGRRWYARHKQEEQEFMGYRNGYQDYTMKTKAGRMEIRKPRVREAPEPYESKIMGRLETLVEDLKRTIMEGYVRGLSTRDIEETFVDQNGKPLLSRTSVSNLNKRFNEEYEEWREQDLSSYDVIYLFVDAVYEAVRRYTNNQAILCAWGICSNGDKVMLGLEAVRSESEEAWSSFFESMIERGLDQPLLIISDGSKGLIKAITGSFPDSERQRCIAHKMRNIMVKVPQHCHDEVLLKVKAIYYAQDIATAEKLADEFVKSYTDILPSAVNCFVEDLESCLTHLKFPAAHRKFIRTTNLIERAFEEQKRRTKVLPQHENERSSLGLVFGVLIRASKKWHRVKMTDYELTILRNIKKLLCPFDNEFSKISFKRVA